MNRFSKFEPEQVFECDSCTYKTKKKANFTRHKKTKRHETLYDIGTEQEPEAEVQEDDIDDAPVVMLPTISINITSDEASILIDHDNDDCDMHSEESEPDFCPGYESTGTDEEETDPPDPDPFPNPNQMENEWFPFSSKMHLLLSVLYSSKTHKVSDEVMAFVIFILKECGVKNVPTISNVKGYLRKQLNVEDMVERHEDKDGNINWTVKPSEMLKLQLANPETAKKISRYPTVESSEHSIHQSSGSKWKQMLFQSAKDKDGQDFFRGNFVTFQVNSRTVHGQITHFSENLMEEKMYVKVLVYLNNTHGTGPYRNIDENCLVKLNKTYTLALDRCKKFNDIHRVTSMKEKVNGNTIDMSEEELEEILMEHSRLENRGLPIVHLPLNLFMDDLSANVSRRWSPIHAAQGQLSGLPLEDKCRGKNVLFFGLSDKMGMLDVMRPICNDIKNCKEFGIEAFDAANKEKCIITTDISLIVTDYQMTSLACNHAGPSAKQYCPKCFVDESDPFKKGELRTKEETMRIIRSMKRLPPGRKLARQKETGIKDHENCLWDYMDPLSDTPIGILHFVYLGLAKQLIKYCYNTLNDHQKGLLESHLESIDQNGFSYRINKSFFKYIDSRQGKDFKHYIAALNMAYAGLAQNCVNILTKLAMISKHVLQKCQPEQIGREVEEYLNLLKDTIPSLGQKRKTHLCVHLIDDIRRHGHPLQYSEDSFEKNHKAVRNSIAHQNGHARSRDTAVQFLNNELMAHLLNGGYIPVTDNWRQADINVIQFGTRKTILNFLGMPEMKEEQFPKLKNIIGKQKDGPGLSVPEVFVLQAILNCGGDPSLLDSPDLRITQFRSSSIQKIETIHIGSYVLYKDEDNMGHIGQITHFFMLSWKANCHKLAVVRKAELLAHTHCQYQMFKCSTEATSHVIFLEDLQESIHAIHDCKGGNCRIVEGSKPGKIEQEMQDVTCTYLKHSKQHNLYIINKCRITLSRDKIVL